MTEREILLGNASERKKEMSARQMREMTFSDSGSVFTTVVNEVKTLKGKRFIRVMTQVFNTETTTYDVSQVLYSPRELWDLIQLMQQYIDLEVK